MGFRVLAYLAACPLLPVVDLCHRVLQHHAQIGICNRLLLMGICLCVLTHEIFSVITAMNFLSP
jgi:uncharacterized metal-binding protein